MNATIITVLVLVQGAVMAFVLGCLAYRAYQQFMIFSAVKAVLPVVATLTSSTIVADLLRRSESVNDLRAKNASEEISRLHAQLAKAYEDLKSEVRNKADKPRA